MFPAASTLPVSRVHKSGWGGLTSHGVCAELRAEGVEHHLSRGNADFQAGEILVGSRSGGRSDARLTPALVEASTEQIMPQKKKRQKVGAISSPLYFPSEAVDALCRFGSPT